MGFLDKIKDASDKMGKDLKEAKEQHDKKVAERNEARGKMMGVVMAEYVGGYGEYRKAKGSLMFFEKQTEFSSPMSTKFTIQSKDIKNIAIEGKDEVNRRVTVTRLLAVGIFAFALKKKSKDQEAYITVELTDGQEVIFFVDNVAPMKLKTKLAGITSLVKQGQVSQQQTATGGNVADELTKLADLKDKGILTQAEFDAKKKQLLGL